MLTRTDLKNPGQLIMNSGFPAQFVDVREGDVVVELGSDGIEKIAALSNSADVVISNSVLKTASNKDQLFKEIYRVLKPYGQFCLSDLVVTEELPANVERAMNLYMGSSGGLMKKGKYLECIEMNGFMAVRIREEELINIDPHDLKGHLSEEEIANFGSRKFQMSRITVMAEKSCCGPVALTCNVEC